MKKLKLNLGEGGFKGFLFRHVEKIVAGVVMLMVLWLLYTGYSGYAKTALKEDPTAVMSLADQMTRNIDRPGTWEDVQKQKQLTEPDFGVRAEKQSKPIEKVAYAVRMPWNPPLLPAKTKRTDPKVLKAIKTEAVAGYGAVALALSESSPPDPLMDEEHNRRLKERRDQLAQAEEKKKKQLEEARKREAEAKKNQAAAGAGKQPKPEAKKPGKPGDKSQQDRDINDLLGGGGPGMGPGGEGRFGGAGAIGVADEEHLAEFHPNSTAIPKGYYFVAVTALVPYKSQWKEYQYCFKDADGYEAQRDTPKYRRYLVERQEEGQDKWTSLSNNQVAATYQTFVADRPEELADPRYVDSILTMPIPPVMKRDLRKFILHSAVPEYVKDEQAPAAEDAKPGEEIEPGKEAKPKADDPWGGDVVIDAGKPGGGRPGMEGGPNGARGAHLARGAGMEGVGGGRPGMAATSTEPEVEYKMFRFYDFNVEPGKKYRYRVKLALEDPNNPKPPSDVVGDARRPGEGGAPPAGGNAVASEKPPISTLAPEVLERLKDENAPKYLRVTDWSEESPYVSVPSTQRMLAGNVTPPPKATATLIAEPEAKVLLTVWDNHRAVDVPLEADVRRGSILDVVKDTDVIHPANLENVKLKDYRFHTGAMVIDMRGGETLPSADKKNPNPLTANGEVLLMNGAGELVACDEMSDYRAYHRIRPESEKSKPASGGGGGAAAEGPGGFNPLDILGAPAARPAPGPVRENKPPRQNH